MRGEPFRHLGGMVVTDHGPQSLRTARQAAAFYIRECAWAIEGRDWRRATSCARRALALLDAVAEASLWRRAAGWRDPEAADQMGRAAHAWPRDTA